MDENKRPDEENDRVDTLECHAENSLGREVDASVERVARLPSVAIPKGPSASLPGGNEPTVHTNFVLVGTLEPRVEEEPAPVTTWPY